MGLESFSMFENDREIYVPIWPISTNQANMSYFLCSKLLCSLSKVNFIVS